jgi:hypothetical protein
VKASLVFWEFWEEIQRKGAARQSRNQEDRIMAGQNHKALSHKPGSRP